MCTAFGKKGNDLIYGFNLDIDPSVWNYDLYMNENYFTVGIKVGKTTYFTHGVNSNGNFSNIPYMNGADFEVEKGSKKERIDLMADRYIKGKYTFKDIKEIIKTKTIVNIPTLSFHSLIGDKKGNMLIVEPGIGNKTVESDYGLITNFPVLTKLDDYSNPFYGKDRYDKAEKILKNSKDDFNVEDGLKLLNEVKQVGKWATRISFVYSRKENSVYYFLDGDIGNIKVHKFNS